MSKKKKKLDELLEEALMPEDEQPYKIPYGWTWVKLKNIVNIKTGKKDANYGTEDGNYPFFTCAKEPSKSPGYSYDEEALLVPGNGNIGTVMYYNGQFEAYQRTYIISSENINLKYLYYHMLYSWGKFNKDKLFGSTISYIKLANLQEYPVALPPVQVQESIVEHIEKYLSKVLKAKQLLEEVKETFELLRAGFLEQVFKFEYHRSYQKDVNNIKTNEIFDFVTSGSRGWAKYYSDSGDIFIRIGNLKHNSISLQLDEIQYVSLPENVEGKRTEVQVGDILVSITADIGRIAVIEDGMQKAYINQHIALARPHKHFYSPYIGWYLATKTGGNQQMMELQRGATKVGLGLNDIKEITIPVPTYKQQKEIAEFIENKLKEFNKSEWFLEVCLNQCSELKQSILQKAFKGELGTNDSNDEPAVEFLKSILQESL
ncbi:restriction endonuclease subunit S [Bacillus wiedmannii]|uniref:restriction endonuclease subunit S n=1 Tax=Bacillus wiedmannii TaxID=1890302 RepID=UPI003CFFB62F